MSVLSGVTAAAAVIKIAVDLGPDVIKVVNDAKPFAERIMTIFKGGNITEEELTKMMADAQRLHESIQSVDASEPVPEPGQPPAPNPIEPSPPVEPNPSQGSNDDPDKTA